MDKQTEEKKSQPSRCHTFTNRKRQKEVNFRQPNFLVGVGLREKSIEKGISFTFTEVDDEPEGENTLTIFVLGLSKNLNISACIKKTRRKKANED